MKVVKVYGALRKRLGRCRFELNVATPAQAIKALCVNFPGLDKWLIDSEKDGVGYRVRVGKQQATPEDVSVLSLPWSEREVFSVTPVIAGAGGRNDGFFGFLGGALLIGAAFLVPGLGTSIATSTFLGTTMGAVSYGAALIGTSLVLGGIAQMISPTPPPIDFEEANRIENFSFSGILNTSQQGLAVPIAYGRVVVGSAVISSVLDVDHSPNDPVTTETLTADLFIKNKS